MASEFVIRIVRRTLSRLRHTSSSVLPLISRSWPLGSVKCRQVCKNKQLPSKSYQDSRYTIASRYSAHIRILRVMVLMSLQLVYTEYTFKRNNIQVKWQIWFELLSTKTYNFVLNLMNYVFHFHCKSTTSSAKRDRTKSVNLYSCLHLKDQITEANLTIEEVFRVRICSNTSLQGKYRTIYNVYKKLQDKGRMKIYVYLPGETKLHDRAICMAVFCLSPVSIQKFIPAFRSVSIVSGTPSCIIVQNQGKRVSSFFK